MSEEGWSPLGFQICQCVARDANMRWNPLNVDTGGLLMEEYLAETLHLTSDTEACRRLFVPATRRSSLGDRAFPVAGAIMEHSPVSLPLCEQFHLT